jgi:hypothetical protein
VSQDLKERIERMLAGLGDTADAVADSLRAKGIKGNICDGECCPISNVLTAEFPEAAAGSWGSEDDWWVEVGHIRTPAGFVSTPPAVKEFIAVFDDGVVEYVEEDGGDLVWPYADLMYDVDRDGPGKPQGAAEAARAEQ